MERALLGAASGRIVWGIAALAAPGLNVRLVGMADRETPELRYMTRVFGSRALALGLGHLLGDPTTRRRWRRLCLMVDACDTAAGLVHLIRGDVPRKSAAGLLAITGGYTVLGALALRSEEHEPVP
ncbi:hypothetical protein ABGB12_25075 [Actinocorallia sp. B10E7]|uniref:hypothetical protein n=1 Tax=Actinocorallia sp. B10E7 TaxID=3153558 RepID=UPI00325DD92B